MDSDKQEIIYCADDDEYRIYCDICDKFFLDRYYNNHLKSQTQKNKFYKRQRLIETNTNISSS